eukprot:TRINITY_DN112707_c0_g1_i1.p1 TRINITY_DN112707_c0_g1~~TRINITY_DN112707_c0_g1_i1.p1  ORF type:complete len:179 (+),score=56.01 TRINITY_DN112707_c0_g1_i1:80-616(+)
MVPMVGLAYWPLLVWLPLLAVQYVAAVYMGSGMQSAVHGITGILVDTPLCSVLKIVWIVMFVLSLDCVRGVFKTGTSLADGSPNTQMFEVYASKEGALVMGLNMAAMMAIQALHVLSKKAAKLETDRDMMKRQATQAGEFSKQLLAAEEKKAEKTVAPESKMPEAKAEEKEGEVRKRD